MSSAKNGVIGAKMLVKVLKIYSKVRETTNKA